MIGLSNDGLAGWAYKSPEPSFSVSAKTSRVFSFLSGTGRRCWAAVCELYGRLWSLAVALTKIAFISIRIRSASCWFSLSYFSSSSIYALNTLTMAFNGSSHFDLNFNSLSIAFSWYAFSARNSDKSCSWTISKFCKAFTNNSPCLTSSFVKTCFSLESSRSDCGSLACFFGMSSRPATSIS